MTRWSSSALVLVLCAAFAGAGAGAAAACGCRHGRSAPPRPRFDYPAAKRTNDVERLHGVALPDPYRWLERDDDPEVQQWVAAEDARARRELVKVEPRAKPLLDAMKAYYADPLPPLRTERGSASFALDARGVTVRVGSAPDRVVVDAKALEPGVRVTSFDPSDDGAIAVVELSKNGADMRTLRVVDVKTGDALEELDGIEASAVVWAKDGFFYTRTPPDAPHDSRFGRREIRFHRPRSAPASDRVVLPASGDRDASAGVNPVAITKDGSRLVVRTRATWQRSEYGVVDLSKPSWPVAPLGVEHGEVRGVVVAGNAVVPWSAGDDDLLRLDAYGRMVVRTYAAKPGETARGFVRHAFYDEGSRALGEAWTPRGATDVYSASPDDTKVIVTREGLGLPPYRFELDPRTGAERPLVASKVAFDRDAFTIDTLEATSKDGTLVPITVLRRKETPLDGSAALMVYGYGGFRVSAEQIFYPPWMAWASMPRGVFASCHLRGGLELGEAWHAAAARRNRQKTIDDLHACIETLQRRGYGSPARTVTQGWSHGGMIVAAAALQRPDLQRVVVSEAPLADMVRFPVYGRGGVGEYGDPDDEGDFRALAAISPVHNVRDGVRYPSFFLTAASRDERVHPMHARKLAAALQHASPESDGTGEVLLYVLWDAGHHGGGKDDANAVLVRAMAWALAELEQPLAAQAP